MQLTHFHERLLHTEMIPSPNGSLDLVPAQAVKKLLLMKGWNWSTTLKVQLSLGTSMPNTLHIEEWPKRNGMSPQTAAQAGQAELRQNLVQST